MSSERLRLVISFKSLKAGDLVVVKPCGHCGATHRGMLTGPALVSGTLLPGNRCVRGPRTVFDIVPRPLPCTNGGTLMVGRATVDRREVYLVDTGLERETSQETSRPLEVVR